MAGKEDIENKIKTFAEALKVGHGSIKGGLAQPVAPDPVDMPSDQQIIDYIENLELGHSATWVLTKMKENWPVHYDKMAVVKVMYLIKEHYSKYNVGKSKPPISITPADVKAEMGNFTPVPGVKKLGNSKEVVEFIKGLDTGYTLKDIVKAVYEHFILDPSWNDHIEIIAKKAYQFAIMEESILKDPADESADKALADSISEEPKLVYPNLNTFLGQLPNMVDVLADSCEVGEKPSILLFEKGGKYFCNAFPQKIKVGDLLNAAEHLKEKKSHITIGDLPKTGTMEVKVSVDSEALAVISKVFDLQFKSLMMMVDKLGEKSHSLPPSNIQDGYQWKQLSMAEQQKVKNGILAILSGEFEDDTHIFAEAWDTVTSVVPLAKHTSELLEWATLSWQQFELDNNKKTQEDAKANAKWLKENAAAMKGDEGLLGPPFTWSFNFADKNGVSSLITPNSLTWIAPEDGYIQSIKYQAGYGISNVSLQNNGVELWLSKVEPGTCLHILTTPISIWKNDYITLKINETLKEQKEAMTVVAEIPKTAKITSVKVAGQLLPIKQKIKEPDAKEESKLPEHVLSLAKEMLKDVDVWTLTGEPHAKKYPFAKGICMALKISWAKDPVGNLLNWAFNHPKESESIYAQFKTPKSPISLYSAVQDSMNMSLKEIK